MPSTPARAAAGMSTSELEVFGGWLAVAEGSQEPRHLRITSIPLLGMILDTLLRSHDFETFETLTTLLGRSELPPREQREVLANLYLEHGFLASAAQEWMAVCEFDGDARAFHGLAQVSVANGQLEDAAVFAGEAVRMDPANHAARALLDQTLPQIRPPYRRTRTHETPSLRLPRSRGYGQLKQIAEIGLKFSAMRAITRPGRTTYLRPIGRNRRIQGGMHNELRHHFGGQDGGRSAPTGHPNQERGGHRVRTCRGFGDGRQIPASPPPEVHEAMAVADQAYKNLKDNGSELRFKVDEATGKLEIEVHDTHGNLLFTLPPHKALEVAEGGSLQ